MRVCQGVGGCVWGAEGGAELSAVADERIGLPAGECVNFTLKRSIGVNFTLISRIVKITLTHGAAFTDTYHLCTYCTGMY